MSRILFDIIENRWAAEIEDVGLRCKSCGQIITVAVAGANYLGENGSYFCDEKHPDVNRMHEINQN